MKTPCIKYVLHMLDRKLPGRFCEAKQIFIFFYSEDLCLTHTKVFKAICTVTVTDEVSLFTIPVFCFTIYYRWYNAFNTHCQWLILP